MIAFSQFEVYFGVKPTVFFYTQQHTLLLVEQFEVATSTNNDNTTQ
jgi:hypothetical protein